MKNVQLKRQKEMQAIQLASNYGENIVKANNGCTKVNFVLVRNVRSDCVQRRSLPRSKTQNI